MTVNELSSLLQAAASISLVGLTWKTLLVLRKYANDTEKISRYNAAQMENSQSPFLTAAFGEGWEIHNQGFGPALTIKFSLHPDQGKGEWRYIADMAQGDKRQDFGYEIGLHIQNGTRNRPFIIQYTSVSGLAYETRIERLEESKELKTTFIRPQIGRG